MAYEGRLTPAHTRSNHRASREVQSLSAYVLVWIEPRWSACGTRDYTNRMGVVKAQDVYGWKGNTLVRRRANTNTWTRSYENSLRGSYLLRVKGLPFSAASFAFRH